VRIANEKEHVYAGRQALEFRSPQQTAELSNGVGRVLARNQEVDILFLRYYTKFDASFDISGSCHNGGGMSAHYFVNGQASPGIPANGYNKFLAEFESWRGDATEPNPGQLNVYLYHPEQRTQWGDHFFPDGTVLPWTYLPGNFGAGFIPRSMAVCKLGQWYCCELMVKANTAGVRNGRIACWLNGALIADFQNLRLRDVDSLKINRFNLSLHSGSNPKGETWKWYDNVVAATSYIGPRSPPAQARRRPVGGIGLYHPSVSGTTLTFMLTNPFPVRVSIYTAQGILIRDLCDAICSSGTHTLRWDCRNNSGAAAPHAMYVVRIRTAGQEWTARMTIVQ
jgi:hypothetical protein